MINTARLKEREKVRGMRLLRARQSGDDSDSVAIAPDPPTELAIASPVISAAAQTELVSAQLTLVAG